MARHFPDFLTAYLDYAKDDFCPDKFHFWTGISVLAGALERKVWIARENFNLYPNLYILMLSFPGMGKSSATGLGVNKFLAKLNSEAGKIFFMGTQNSHAAFIKQMERRKDCPLPSGLKYQHCSSFFYASEGSNALQEITGGGSIISSFTDFYDCPEYWEKVLVKDRIQVVNACCNLLACATFSFLETLVPKKEAEGGFASRLLYIVHDEITVRNPQWNKAGRDPGIADRLLEDLHEIYNMSGPFRPTREFISAYEEWFPKQDQATQSIKSERMQRFLARKHTNLLKLSQICAASEGSSLTLDVRHWERALSLIEEVEKDIPNVVANSVNKADPANFAYVIMKLLRDAGGTMGHIELRQALLKSKTDTAKAEFHINEALRLKLVNAEINGVGERRIKLIANPDEYL